MASYTKQLRTLIDKNLDDKLSLKEKIELGREKLFDFDYPFFSEDYRKQFETNFIMNFFMREIGFETDVLFKFKLETWLNINMPYWNKMFESELMEYDPLENVNIQKTSNRDNTVNENNTRATEQNINNSEDVKTNTKENEVGNQKGTSFNRDLSSDTPDDRLQISTGAEGTGVIEYASTIDESRNSGNQDTTNDKTAEGTSNTLGVTKANVDDVNDRNLSQNENIIEVERGKSKNSTYQHMILNYRKTLLRIERDIFNEMNELFMLVR